MHKILQKPPQKALKKPFFMQIASKYAKFIAQKVEDRFFDFCFMMKVPKNRRKKYG